MMTPIKSYGKAIVLQGVLPKIRPLLPICSNGNAPGRWVRGLWAPLDCYYRKDLFNKFPDCSKKHKTIFWIGDSNSRRVLKALNPKGSLKWCSDSTRSSEACMCEDKYDGWSYESIPNIKFIYADGLQQSNHEMATSTSYNDSTIMSMIPMDAAVIVIGHLVNWDAGNDYLYISILLFLSLK